MKKVLMLMVFPLCLAGCQSTLEKNIQQMLASSYSNIKSIDVCEADSVLSDAPMGFAINNLLNAENDYLAEKITIDKLKEAIEKAITYNKDIVDSWQYGAAVNDSLCKLDKYNYEWRLAYNITVKMEDGTSKNIRVLMDKDGITPRCTENEFIGDFNKYGEEIMKAEELLKK